MKLDFRTSKKINFLSIKCYVKAWFLSALVGSVAQSVEQKTENLCVGGSIPSRATSLLQVSFKILAVFPDNFNMESGKTLDIYSQFRDFRIFKRFKYLLGDWWNVDVLVVFKSGKNFYYDSIEQIHNPIVKSLLKSPLFKNHFLGSLQAVINKKANSETLPRRVTWKQTGLDLFVTPLVWRGAPLNAFIVATGFAPKKEKALHQSLLYLNFSKVAIKQKINNLKTLSQTNEVYIQKMLSILAEEFFALLQEKNKQEKLIKELNYKNSHKKVGQLLGKSPAMKYIFNALEKIKNHDSNLLIQGENGTGKRLLAQTIHAKSSRADKAFYIQNFSNFKGRLVELEFFGYGKKVFPTVGKAKKAVLENLNGGTVFLNEIENTSLKFQRKLVRFLKENIFFSEGDKKSKKANVRLIFASSQDLKALVKKGQFNKELYFAISAMLIKTSPLKNRKEDILLLIQHFFKRKGVIKKFSFSSEAIKVIYNYSWPGNIRELENEVVRLISVIGKQRTSILVQDLSPHIRNFSASWGGEFQKEKQNLKKILSSIEKKILRDYLRQNNWNKSRVAKLLGISRTSLILKAKEYNILKKQGA